MARSYGRVFASIWDDGDFRCLPSDARLGYMFLISQPDLDHAGVIPLRIGRWADALGATRAEVEKMLTALDAARFTVTDWRKEELLVRSLIRRDEVWKQPNVFKSAAASAASCKSAQIKGVLFTEIRRLELSSASREIQRTRDELLTLLEPFGRPSPTPPGASQDSNSEPAAGAPVDNETDELADTGNGAGCKGSGGVGEPSATGTYEPRGKGSSRKPVPTALPPSPEPSPLPRTVADVVGHPTVTSARARDDDDHELVAAVVDAVLVRTERALTDAEARTVAAKVLARAARSGTPVHRPHRYVAQAIADEPDLYADLLACLWQPPDAPARLAERPAWCEDPNCNRDTRRREHPETGADLGPCPLCSGTLTRLEAS